MKRIAIIGSGGAGKSTFARELGEILNITPTHLDVHYWRPGWQETPRDAWREIQKELLEGERWIMDGNYGGTMDLRLEAADTIIFLDMPRLLCVWRVLKQKGHDLSKGGAARPGPRLSRTARLALSRLCLELFSQKAARGFEEARAPRPAQNRRPFADTPAGAAVSGGAASGFMKRTANRVRLRQPLSHAPRRCV